MKLFLLAAGLEGCMVAVAQDDSARVQALEKVVIIGYKAMNGIGHLNEIKPPFIFTGKKTEVIVVDSIDANKAINNTRQILGRIPGLNIVESETGGFVANGIGIRGLNPVQSLELNVRQNGYNIVADVFGYNETYYLPPMEAVERVEIIKGASSLQFGSQLGGMVNYVLKEGSSKKPSYSSMNTAGSGGLFNSNHAISGASGKLRYISFLNYRVMQGWRANSHQQQLTGYGNIKYQASNNLSMGLEYSLLRNQIKMPGGLTDAQFAADSRASVRSRNWVKSPWNILSANMEKKLSQNTSLYLGTTFLSGERSLVWFNALPDVADKNNPVSGAYANREVDKEIMKSTATELRLSHNYQFGKVKNTLAAGARFSYASFKRKEEAPGTNGSDFDLTTTGEYEEQYNFQTINLAAFLENRIQLSDRFSISPGIRLETLETEAEGEVEISGVEKEVEEEKERQFVLLGIGLQHEVAKQATAYGNITQSYRPVDYAQLLPLGSVSKVDPDLKDPKGWNADLGIRGTVRQFFNYDISLFYLRYNDRIGTVLRQDDAGNAYSYRTNLAQSVHKGVESYLELNITRGLKVSTRLGNLSLYHSFAYTDARYTNGEFKGNRVEFAPQWISRIGLSYAKKWFSISLQFSHQSKAYGDAANKEHSSNPVFGVIPAYSVMDWSMTGNWKKFKLKTGINNLTDQRYFTQRTDEYPGPGLIPSIGRSVYVGVGWEVF
ncbi:TonB-dependent receptor family protein [Flavisolibacter nicotianae]|uniref:TonB-dependent receptor family protein n=1 Tax=Flavisolibacter nicotianae TaxID=2364882 RepID=UPI0013C48FC8|nr:TonB-dependent receptor [Flavisolibacter nicotianae]